MQFFPPSGDALFAAYVLVFAIAAVICFVSIRRARRIEDRDTRRGFVGLLVLSGCWAAAHVGYLVAPPIELKLAFYYVGLIVGIGAVGPWLYFCSAYSGRTIHRMPTIRRGAIGVFLTIVAVKLTNPLHHLYFRTELVETPFRHLAVSHGLFHWLAMGIAYALAVVGYFMLVELLWRVGSDVKPFALLLGITGLPIALDVLGELSPALLNMTYSPLGVAAFAVGTLYVYLEKFETIGVAGEHDDPIVVVDQDDVIREFNSKASRVFPDLEHGRTIETVIPDIDRRLTEENLVLELERDGGIRYYRISVNPFSSHGGQMAIIFSDVTETEQYRRELEHQNERLDRFASIVSHDLRNPLNVALLRIEAERAERDTENLTGATTALHRMQTLIDDLLAMARQGDPVDDLREVSLAAIAERSWDVVDTRAATLHVTDDCTFSADPDRLQQCFENLFRNAIDHGSDSVAITVGPLADGSGFYVADDGPGIPDDQREGVFEFGHSTDEDGTGYGLAIVREIVAAHGWAISVTESEAGGARFEITDVTVDA